MTRDELVYGAVKLLCNECYTNSASHGFWEKERNRGEMFALMHAEISEALEYDRHGNPKSDHIEFSGVEEELADVLIRIFDFAGGFRLDLGAALIAKMEFNKSRPHKHGKQF